MKKNIFLLTILLLTIGLSGCALMYTSDFQPPLRQDATTVLKENDFETVSRNLEGNHKCVFLNIGYYPLFYFELPLGDPRLTSNALAEMYMDCQNLVEGEPTQLINWAVDQYDVIIPIPVITPSVKSATYRADLIKYLK